jgi:hypothetical protein
MSRKLIYSPVHIVNKDKPPDESAIAIHCHKRLRITITLGLLIRKITEKKNITETKISFEGAKIQDGKGNKQRKTEAAHNLPRDILLNGRSIWDYVNDPDCNFHERVKKQIYLTAASTVVVEREINYLDSQWERNGLLEICLDYLSECIKVKIDSENELENLVKTAKKFINGCKETLNKTKEIIESREIYKKKKEKLDKAFEQYYYTIDNFNYNQRIETLLNIYKLSQYK